jgi:hypothetical protein
MGEVLRATDRVFMFFNLAIAGFLKDKAKLAELAGRPRADRRPSAQGRSAGHLAPRFSRRASGHMPSASEEDGEQIRDCY